MSKRMELLAGAIALGLLLNAAASFYRIVEPREATAQSAITDVNIVQLAGKPMDAYEWSDGTVSPRVVPERVIAGSEEYPLFVKTAP